MAKKSSKISTRTYLIIIIIMLIVLGGYLIVTNLPESIDALTPEQININKGEYIGQTVTVVGTFNYFGADPVILTTSTAIEEDRTLKINHSNIHNATDDLFAGEKYYFTGTIEREFPDNPILIDKIILVLDKFERI